MRAVSSCFTALIVLLGTGAVAVGTSTSGAAVSTPKLSLVSQSVDAIMSAGGTAHFTVDLNVDPSTNLSFTLYPAATTRSGFLAAEGDSGLASPLGTSGSISAHCGGQVGTTTSFSLTLHASGHSFGSCAPRVATISLHCSYASQTCGGIYPLRIASATTSFVTFVTLVAARVAAPLEIASVLRFSPGHQAATSASQISQSLLSEEQTPADLLVSPSALARAARSSGGAHAVTQLVHWSKSSVHHEVLDVPLVPLDPAVLSASGLASVSHQALNRGRAIMDGAGFTRTSVPAGWVAPGSPSPQTITDVRQLGYSHIIISDESLLEPTSSGVYWGQPFGLSGAPSPVTALAVDPVLSAEFQGGSNPRLRAYQLLADLAFHHFERPSLSTPQGVIVMAPASWVPSTSFLGIYLAGLQHNPLLAPATLSHLFASLPVGGNGAAPVRELRTTQVSAWPSGQVKEYRTQEQRQVDFASATPAATGTSAVLSDALLDASAAQLGRGARSLVLAHARAALTAQATQLSISSASITTTALRESIPITITSRAHYPLKGILTIESQQLSFPRGQRFSVDITRSTKVIRIPTRAPTTGSFTATVTLTTPRGALVLAKAKLLIVASRTSIVAIILTIGAFALLMLWWVRTSMASRRSKRRRH